jgi:two-component system NtrC family sensor kinase
VTPEERERLHRMEHVGLLAAGLSHDFNNTAMCVLGELATAEAHLRELRKLVGTGPAAEAALRAIEGCQRSLETVDGGLQMAVSHTRDLLRLYRGETRGPGPAGTDLRRSAERALRLVGGRLRPVAELRNGDQLRVAVSEDVLVRVFLNLLLNASDAFPPGAAQPRVRLQISAAGGIAVCDIIDNGPGVAPQVLERLFQPFASSRPEGGGTGLGLAVSRELIREAGGDLQLVETGAGGTVFRLTLPLVAGSPSVDDGEKGVAHLIAATLRETTSRREPTTGPKRSGLGLLAPG